MKYQTVNGFTKESMKEVIKKEFKGKSVDLLGKCSYRSQTKDSLVYNIITKCVVGCFIKDEHYYSAFENKSVSFFENKPEYNHIIKSLPLEVVGMQDFQVLHDSMPDSPTLSLEYQKCLLIGWIDLYVK